eukprot:scaffold21988_cov63-Phaeocystis_antarctica.AAC.2
MAFVKTALTIKIAHDSISCHGGEKVRSRKENRPRPTPNLHVATSKAATGGRETESHAPLVT